MPTCPIDNITPVMQVIFKHYNSNFGVKWNKLRGSKVPRGHYSVLDVGIGNGKYGMLIREYLDGCWFGRRYEEPATWRVRLIGVEPFWRYISPAHKYHYDEIHPKPIEHLLRDGEFTDKSFDLVLISDMIEHLPKPQGIKLLENVKDILKPTGIALVTTPNYFIKQGVVDGCKYETHKSLWNRKEFASVEEYRNIDVQVVNSTIICVLTP